MRKSDFFDHLSQGADLPGESLPGLPIIEIAGDRRVLIENHSGVTCYGRTRIHVKVSYGEIHICGECMELTMMTRHQLIIGGKISTVTLLRRKC